MNTDFDRLVAARPAPRVQLDDLVSLDARQRLVDVITGIPRPASGTDFEIVPVGSSDSRLRSDRRSAITLVSAAVIAVVLALGSLPLIHGFGGGGSNGPGGGGSHEGSGSRSLLMRSLPFSIGSTAEVSIVGGVVNADGSGEAWLYGRGRRYHLDLLPHQQRPNVSYQDAQLVDIDGRPGYLACPVPHGALLDLQHCGGGQLAWRYRPGEWADLATGKSATVASRATTLLRVARGLNFSETTPLHTPISFPEAPGGAALSTWVVSYVGQQTLGAAGSSVQWSISVSYEAEAGQGPDEVDIDAEPGLPVRQGRRLTINGRPATWSATTHRLWLAAGHGVELMVRADDWGLVRVSSFAKTIAVARDPNNLATWFSAPHALP